MATIDPTVILIGVVIDFAIDLIVFWFFHIKGLMVAITIGLNFLLPYIPFMFLIWSRPTIDQLTPAPVDLVATYVVNLVNYVVSAGFGYLISVPIYLIFGRPRQTTNKTLAPMAARKLIPL